MEQVKDLKIGDEVLYLNKDKTSLNYGKIIYIQRYFFFFKKYFIQSYSLRDIRIMSQFNLFFKKDNND